ncbi:TonB-dependent receptor [Adhaeribacter rhizoryzae]|uniref:TonB-dependent receptor n=1 Tax=Adhaeribacter rhizoryzae TaxID=2607907 RepID=A0A5M6DQ17_9BACT|nr:TonB-dependent receptor [Adhaeribacter rhizoryzae]KAA5548342.1 TonB-dependent receptor [Adhaeribacter rhizoryzae]
MKKFILTTVILLLGAISLYAQVTTSSITGSVRDNSGEPLIGATVKATHQPSGTVYGTTTNTDGRFQIQNMRIGGPYAVEVSYIGYQNQTYNNIALSLGVPYSLDARISEGGTALAEVVINANRSEVFNATKTGAATNIGTEQLNNLPTVTRSLEDFTRLTPQANGVGFAGRDNRYNNIQIDGANFNNAFGTSSSDLLPGGSTRPVSIDAIEEIQVNIAPYDVRQSGFTGAGINAITRSGTNTYTGSAYTFYRNQDLRGTQVGRRELPAQPDNSTITYGARFGGPIIKNKLFFFGNLEREKEIFPGVTWIANRPGATGNVARTTAVDLERVRQHLINTYNYDPGAYENYANEFENKSTRFLTRLDWNISQNHRFTTRFNYAEGTSDQTVNATSAPNPRGSSARIGPNALAFQNANYGFLNKVWSLTGELNSTLSSRISNQILATYSFNQATRTTPGGLFPFVDIWQGGDNYISFGTELFSAANDLINDNYTFIDNFTYQAGKHTLTAGASYELIKYGNLFLRNASSYYRYPSVDAFINNEQPTSFGLSYAYPGQDPYTRVSFGLGGLYLQDKYSFNNQLDVTFGIRGELPLYLNDIGTNPQIDKLELLDQDGNPTTYKSGTWPKSRIMWSPRVGFNYDVLGDGTFKLRGGTGIFAGRIPFVYLTNMPGATGLITNTLDPAPSSALPNIRFNPDPTYWLNNGPENVFLKSPAGGTPSTIALVDEDFRMPQIWRSSLGVDYTIPGTPLVATTDLLYTKDIKGIYQFNANRKPAAGQMNYAGDNRDFWNGSANALYNNATGPFATVLSNTNKGYSLAATVGLSLPSQTGFFGSIYYTYTDARDITGNPGSTASSVWQSNYSVNDANEQLLGISEFAIPHRIVGNISYRQEYLNHLGTTVSLFYNGAHQGRFSYTTNGDLNKDGVSLDLLYIPQNGSELNFATRTVNRVTFTAEEQRAAYDEFVKNSKQLSNAKGDYVLRNNGLMPWLNRFDFRLLQDVFTNIGERRNTLQVSFDVQNAGNLVGNFFNLPWGIAQQLNGGSNFNYPLLNVASVNAEGIPTFNMITVVNEQGQTVLPTKPFRNTFNNTTTWRMQLGLRYSF